MKCAVREALQWVFCDMTRRRKEIEKEVWFLFNWHLESLVLYRPMMVICLDLSECDIHDKQPEEKRNRCNKDPRSTINPLLESSQQQQRHLPRFLVLGDRRPMAADLKTRNVRPLTEISEWWCTVLVMRIVMLFGRGWMVDGRLTGGT